MMQESVNRLGNDFEPALFSPSQDNVIETHEHAGDFKEW